MARIQSIVLSCPAAGAGAVLDHYLPVCDILRTGHTVPPHLQVEGLFWNYFSIGMDATAAYGFHHLRETKPWAAPSRMINQAWYAYYGCSSGWFCCARPIRNTVSLKVRCWALLCRCKYEGPHVAITFNAHQAHSDAQAEVSGH